MVIIPNFVVIPYPKQKRIYYFLDEVVNGDAQGLSSIIPMAHTNRSWSLTNQKSAFTNSINYSLNLIIILQVEAVRFLWDCMCETVERSNKPGGGGGCILAHCMGLGKTLSVCIHPCYYMYLDNLCNRINLHSMHLCYLLTAAVYFWFQ